MNTKSNTTIVQTAGAKDFTSNPVLPRAAHARQMTH
jgi:hypothetical protein